jgi:BMFP domain-containing protein YqiC
MKAPFVHTGSPLSRRHFLRGTGALTLGIPLLEAMTPSFVRAAGFNVPKRFVAICAGLGFHGPYLFPETPGKDYVSTPYLDLLKEHRQDVTLFSGLCHPNQQGNNGHASELTWLTSAPRPGLAGFKNTISLDQAIAKKVGMETRFPYLSLATSGRGLSWTETGVGVPGQQSPAKLYKALFVNGSEKEIQEELKRLKRGHSILDVVQGEAKKLNNQLGHHDREKLAEYFAAVRDLETRLHQSKEWATRPKPAVAVEQPKDVADRNDAIAKQRLMYDMMVLALQTDSTRTITFAINGMNAPPSNIAGVDTDWHNLSHHGKDEEKIDELRLIEEAEFKELDRFLTKLKAVRENQSSLLQETAVLFGSNLGNASSHDWHNLPLIVAGGGYKHGQYLAHDPKHNERFANLLIQLGQRMGLETDRFGSSIRVGIDGFA